MLRILRRFLRAREGNVTLVSAIVLPAVLAAAGLATEYGNALNYKSTDQRVADAAAFGTATVYNADSSVSVTSVAQSIAALNGVPSANVSAAVVASPSGSGASAVRVIVTSSAPLVLSKLIAPSMTSLAVSATAYAELKGGTPSCVVALKAAGTGVTLSGGTTVTAQSCGVNSDAAVSVPCGTSITTTTLTYNSAAAPSQPCNGIQPPAGKTLTTKKQATPDPLAGNSEVAAAQSRISATQALTAPSAPAAVAATDITFDYSTSGKTLPAGCSAVFASPVWTVTCTGNGPFNFGVIKMGGGITLKFNTGGAATAVYNIKGLYQIGAAQFGPGTYNVLQGLSTAGGVNLTFAAGAYNFGTGICSGGYSLCNTATSVTFGGPSSFVFSGGVYNSGGEILTMGSGSTNSFYIGPATNGDAFTAGGGAKTTFADATGSGLFQMAGNLNIAGGGSCTWISAATNHDINGYINAAGGLTLGSGLYTVDGYVAFGASSGGDVTCNGVTTGVFAQDVTFAITAATTIPSGCAGQAFCVGAGYGHVTMSAPTSGSMAKLLVVGPTSGTSTAGATFTGGASNTNLSGAFYFPQGAISLSGAASVGSGAGQCLELIGSQVTLSGGSAVASSCISTSASGGSVVLVG